MTCGERHLVPVPVPSGVARWRAFLAGKEGPSYPVSVNVDLSVHGEEAPSSVDVSSCLTVGCKLLELWVETV